MDTSIRAVGQRGSDDVEAERTKDGVTVTMWADDVEAFAYFDPDTTLQLGEWLIAQAIAHGAGRKALAESGKEERDDQA